MIHSGVDRTGENHQKFNKKPTLQRHPIMLIFIDFLGPPGLLQFHQLITRKQFVMAGYSSAGCCSWCLCCAMGILPRIWARPEGQQPSHNSKSERVSSIVWMSKHHAVLRHVQHEVLWDNPALPRRPMLYMYSAHFITSLLFSKSFILGFGVWPWDILL